MYTITNIIAAVDFSPQTKIVIDTALGITRVFSAKLWIVHIASPDPDFVGYKVGPVHERDWRAETLRSENQQLHDLATAIRSDEGIDVTALLVQGEIVETILEQATKVNANLIVMGTHGHSVLMSALLGSVSEGTVRKSKTPVLLVPSATNLDKLM